jgi:hypothetical protein
MRGVHKKRIQIGIFLLVIIVLICIVWKRSTTESFFDKKEACDAVASDNTALNAVPGIKNFSKLLSSIKGSESILNELKAMKTEACSASATSYSCTTLTGQVAALEAKVNSANTYKNNTFFSSTVTPVVNGILNFVNRCTAATDAARTASIDNYDLSLNKSSLNFSLNNPLDIPNCVSWLDASIFNSQARDTIIKRWAPASSSTGSTQFSMVGSAIVKTGELNNKAVLQFTDGHAMSLCTAQTASDGRILCGGTSFNEPGAYTMFLVSRQTGGLNARLFTGGTSPNDNILYGYWSGSKNILYIEGWLASPGIPSNTSWDVFRIRRGTNNNGSFYNNRLFLKSYTSTLGIKGFNINQGGCCGNERSNGQVAEIIIYNRELSDKECETVEAYLYRKWFP